ncbi:MAG: potassium channel family protein, partial [Hyphomicrobiaceae bacterium]
MLSFFYTLLRFGTVIRDQLADPEFRNVSILVVMIILLGTAFYSYAEGWGWLDSMYFSVVTLATVGYGDLAPKTAAGKIFTMIYTFIGLGVFVVFVRHVADSLMKQNMKDQERFRRLREIEKIREERRKSRK